MSAPASVPDRVILLFRLTQSAQWDRVLTTAMDWLAADPDEPQAHFCAAQALINLERHDEAEPHLARTLSRRPEDAATHRLMAVVQFGRKNYAAADQAIHDALALDPEDPLNWYQLAWMCHAQHDLRNGLKWASRALALAPDNPDILNLYALCGGSPVTASAMEEVLALDPEHAVAHNNLGVDYLNAGNYARAEECFQQALMLEPTLKLARRNLLLVIKERDLLYRVLCAPRDFLVWIRKVTAGDESRKRNIFAGAMGLIIWILIFKIVLVGFIFWLGLVWPLVKFYEFLVVGDLRKRAGEVGAQRGGWFGYRRWPRSARLAIFAAGLIGFWAMIYAFLWSPQNSGARSETAATVLVAAVLGGLALYYGHRSLKGGIARYHAWRRQRRLRKLESYSP